MEEEEAEELEYELTLIKEQNSKEFLNQLETIRYTKDTTKLEYGDLTDCVICIDPFIEHQKILRIPTCRHFFHPDCLKKWFESKA